MKHGPRNFKGEEERAVLELSAKPEDDRFKNLVWMSSQDMAYYLRMSVPALRNKVYRGQIPYYKWAGRIYFKKEEVDLMLEKSRCWL